MGAERPVQAAAAAEAAPRGSNRQSAHLLHRVATPTGPPGRRGRRFTKGSRIGGGGGGGGVPPPP